MKTLTLDMPTTMSEFRAMTSDDLERLRGAAAELHRTTEIVRALFHVAHQGHFATLDQRGEIVETYYVSMEKTYYVSTENDVATLYTSGRTQLGDQYVSILGATPDDIRAMAARRRAAGWPVTESDVEEAIAFFLKLTGNPDTAILDKAARRARETSWRDGKIQFTADEIAAAERATAEAGTLGDALYVLSDLQLSDTADCDPFDAFVQTHPKMPLKALLAHAIPTPVDQIVINRKTVPTAPLATFGALRDRMIALLDEHVREHDQVFAGFYDNGRRLEMSIGPTNY